jgi:hypothetical protein
MSPSRLCWANSARVMARGPRPRVTSNVAASRNQSNGEKPGPKATLRRGFIGAGDTVASDDEDEDDVDDAEGRAGGTTCAASTCNVASGTGNGLPTPISGEEDACAMAKELEGSDGPCDVGRGDAMKNKLKLINKEDGSGTAAPPSRTKYL